MVAGGIVGRLSAGDCRVCEQWLAGASDIPGVGTVEQKAKKKTKNNSLARTTPSE